MEVAQQDPPAFFHVWPCNPGIAYGEKSAQVNLRQLLNNPAALLQ